MMPFHYYIQEQQMPVEEDFTHEFKGHKNISIDELPPWTQETVQARASRRSASRTLNAFLNTGKGGTMYLGVLDNGIVKGFRLTDDQKDHVVLSLKDVMGRYVPPVKPHRYSIRFVPVVDNVEEGENIAKEDVLPVTKSPRCKDHQIRDHTYCWCDRDSVAMYNVGKMSQVYVIEISIHAWDPDDPLNLEDGLGKMINLHPIHENEEGTCFFRMQASLVKYTAQQIFQLTRQEVQKNCLEKLNELRQKITEIENGAY